jgi:hypothetical protein
MNFNCYQSCEKGGALSGGVVQTRSLFSVLEAVPEPFMEDDWVSGKDL